MSSSWHKKKEKQRLEAEEREIQAMNNVDFEGTFQADVRGAAMGEGDEELFEKKLSKEEKKALAKKKREAKKKAKNKGKKGAEVDDDEKKDGVKEAERLLRAAKLNVEGVGAMDNEASEKLAEEGIICTFSTNAKGVDARSRDINIQNFTLQFNGIYMLDGTEIVLNHGNRYGLIGRNGCGKSTLLKALGARAVPIPNGIDIFHLQEEIEASDTITAFDAVMSVDEVRTKIEQEVENLNTALSMLTDDDDNDGEGKTVEEQQDEIMELLNDLYERLDALDADTAEKRAREILKGLGFTHQMMEKKTGDFSGGWRMRISLARALFIQPTLLLLDEPTNHLDMEAVIWLEDYLSKWNRILFLISHSQDFLNNVCTHMVHFTNKRKLVTYDGNYDGYIKTKGEIEENQLKQYKWEQDQIKSMKEYIARFGHGTSKNAKQAQSKQKVLDKMVRGGLTEKPEVEKLMNFKFPDPGHLPPPVLAFRDVSFAYPNCKPLYSNVDFGVDLDSRVALVGPNGAGKTTLIKLMSGELQPSLGDIRPHGHLKLGRFTQHFVDVLDLTMTPLDFFEKHYPDDSRQDARKYLGRFGVSGKMQVQKMEELSDGQKSRVVFAKLGRENPHILLLDEPTNHLDMESIDALALAIQEFEGGMVLVSHDMRLISQVAKEIWICDNKCVTKYQGDIQNFKMDMRKQMGIDGPQKLKGDASELNTEQEKKKKPIKSKPKKEKKKLEVLPPTKPKPKPKPEPAVSNHADDIWGSDDDDEQDTYTTQSQSTISSAPAGRYIPPHLRNR